jgi:hypothetical protein
MKRPEEPAVRRLAHRQLRLLAIVDPPLGPWPAALRSSVRSPGTVPGIAPQAGSTVNVGPFGQELEWTFEGIGTSGLSTNLRSACPTCPPNELGRVERMWRRRLHWLPCRAVTCPPTARRWGRGWPKAGGPRAVCRAARRCRPGAMRDCPFAVPATSGASCSETYQRGRFTAPSRRANVVSDGHSDLDILHCVPYDLHGSRQMIRQIDDLVAEPEG